MKKIYLSLLGCLLVGALCATSKIEEATVTLPYTELASLLDRVHAVERAAEEVPEPPKPPVDILVHAAAYALDCGLVDRATLTASFELSNLSEEWQTVPLMASDMAIRSIEPIEAKVLTVDGMLCLLLEPKASASVQLELLAGAMNSGHGSQVIATFDAIPAAHSSLSVMNAPTESNVIVSGAVAEGGDSNRYGLPSSGGAVRVKLYNEEAVLKAEWKGLAQYLVSDVDGELEVQCQLRLTAMNNGRTSFALLGLPDAAYLNEVQSEGLQGKPSVERTAGGSHLRLNWADDEATSRQVAVRYTLPFVSKDEAWALGGIGVAHTSSWREVYYFAAFDGLDIIPTDREWLVSGRIPEWVQRASGAQDLRTLENVGHQPIQFTTRLMPRLSTSVATIAEANFATQLVGEGGQLHKAGLKVEHGEKAAYRFVLPSGGRLLACSVGGRKVEPLLLEDGVLLVNLPKPQNGTAVTAVDYTYTAKGASFNPVEGKMELELPWTSLFVHKLKWAVLLPDAYQSTALEGNVVIIEGGQRPGQSVILGKQIFHDETPSASLYYTRRDLNK